MRNPEALYSTEPLRCLISREWPSYLTISLLFICLFILINSFDYHVLAFLCAIVVACLVYNILRHVVMKLDDFFVCISNECCLFEKAEQLNTNLYEADIINRSELRSRYAKFILKQEEERLHNPRRAFTRDREPSRIPVKKLAQIMNKSRGIRGKVRKYISKNVPRSSKIHCYVNKCNFLHEKYTQCHRRRKMKRNIPLRSQKSSNHTISLKLLNTFISKYLSCCYKNSNHIMNYVKFALSADVEKNPGPVTTIDPSMTICGPYSLGNIALFGLNAGKQCVAMSLCALIYNKHHHAINNSEDLVKILSVGNELYSVLSRVYNQEYLLLTELPNAITVFDCNYEMQYSNSYTGNILTSSSIDYQFCMPFGNAIQILMSQDYHMFLMTIQCS